MRGLTSRQIAPPATTMLDQGGGIQHEGAARLVRSRCKSGCASNSSAVKNAQASGIDRRGHDELQQDVIGIGAVAREDAQMRDRQNDQPGNEEERGGDDAAGGQAPGKAGAGLAGEPPGQPSAPHADPGDGQHDHATSRVFLARLP